MHGKNYAAWLIDPQQFFLQKTWGEKMEFLLHFAILAPSSHNTQPWRFHIDAEEKSIAIFADLSRRLVQSDATGRMLYIALGCAAENIAVAADYYGLAARTEYNSALSDSFPDPVLKMHLQENELHAYPGEIFDAIARRVSYRAAYEQKNVPAEYLKILGGLAEKNGVHLDVVINTEEKNMLAKIGGEGMKNCMHGRAFRWELAHWLRPNGTHASDGMPGEGHEMSLFVSLLAPFMLRFIDVSAVEREKAIRRIKNFPAVGVLSTASDDALAWVKTGQALQRILLDLTSKGLAASIMVAAIEDSAAREKLTNFLQVRAGNGQQPLRPQMFFGFGYPVKAVPHSPRRDIKNVLG